jgi:hypothetical protein
MTIFDSDEQTFSFDDEHTSDSDTYCLKCHLPLDGIGGPYCSSCLAEMSGFSLSRNPQVSSQQIFNKQMLV